MIPAGAVALARRFEGLGDGDRATPGLQPYLCPAGYWTIGYGHRCPPDHPSITEAEAETLLASDLAWFAREARALVKAPMTEGQHAALTDFAFNLGAGRLAASTLLTRLNRGDHEGAAAEFPKWVFAGGRRLAGLVLRREVERRLFLA